MFFVIMNLISVYLISALITYNYISLPILRGFVVNFYIQLIEKIIIKCSLSTFLACLKDFDTFRN